MVAKKVKRVPELALLTEPVNEAPPVIPPKSLLPSLEMLRHIFEQHENTPGSDGWYRVSQETRHKDAAQRVAQRLNAAARWLGKHNQLPRSIEVRVRPLNAPAQTHFRSASRSAGPQRDSWAVFVKLPDRDQS